MTKRCSGKGIQFRQVSPTMTQSATHHFLVQCPGPKCRKGRKRRHRTVPLLFFLLFIILLPALFAQTPERTESSSLPLYVVQPNDLLKIFVWKQPDMSGPVLVRPDGRISLPLVQ